MNYKQYNLFAEADTEPNGGTTTEKPERAPMKHIDMLAILSLVKRLNGTFTEGRSLDGLKNFLANACPKSVDEYERFVAEYFTKPDTWQAEKEEKERKREERKAKEAERKAKREAEIFAFLGI